MNASDGGPTFYAFGYIVLTIVIGKWADSRGRGALAIGRVDTTGEKHWVDPTLIQRV